MEAAARHRFEGEATVQIARERPRETFVPLAHAPGHAEVDFGEAVGVIGGVRATMARCATRSSYGPIGPSDNCGDA
jgi:hypothetical protein